jgi:hypothetical protein
MSGEYARGFGTISLKWANGSGYTHRVMSPCPSTRIVFQAETSPAARIALRACWITKVLRGAPSIVMSYAIAHLQLGP